MFAANPVQVGHFIKGAMGVNSITTVASGVLFQNDFTMRTADFDNKYPVDPFTFEIFRDVTSSQRYSGVAMSSIEFNVIPNQDLRTTVNVIGTDATNIAATTPSFVNSPTSPFKFDTASISLASSANADLEAATITVDNLLEGVPTLNNSNIIAKIRRTNFQQIRVSGDIAFENNVEYDKFRQQSEQAMLISMTAADSFQIIFDLPRVVYSAFPLGIAGRDRQVISFEGIARFHTGSNQAVKVQLTTTNTF